MVRKATQGGAAEPGRLVVDERAAAVILGVAVRTMQSWRLARRGPRWVKYSGSGGAVRYRLSDLEAWLEANVIDPEARP